MKMKPNKPTILLLGAAMLFSILSAGTSSLAALAAPEQSGQNPNSSSRPGEEKNRAPDTQHFSTYSEDIHTQTKSLSNTGGRVTYETTADYVHTIYANGEPLIIKASNSVDYVKLYLDSNGNGLGEPEEEIVDFKGDGTVTGGGIFYRDGDGYFLPNSSVYGGAKEGRCQYDTDITLTGPTDSSGKYNIRLIFGGNKSGSLTGNTHVTISGGNAGWVFGGGNEGELNGDTSIYMTGGSSLKNMYGGSLSGQINGNTHIHIEAGQVASVYGGNENSGLITGNTELTFDANSTAEGWIYGGGAGYSDSAATEVAGSANIRVNGGTFFHNLYGGGAFRGAKVGGSSITVNDGVFSGWIYGGGEETSLVANQASITIKGGNIPAVCASGAGFNNTKAQVQDAELLLQGGTVGRCLTHPNEADRAAALNGDFSLQLSGNTFSNTELYLGQTNPSVQLKNAAVTLTDTSLRLLKLQSQITGKLSVTLKHADLAELVLLKDTLAPALEADLTYTDCGSSTGRFGTFVQGSNNYFTDRDNPLLIGSQLNQNQFSTLTFQNSYVNYYDDTLANEDNSPKACAEKLVINGGALRITGNMLTNMPKTEFQNNPLLIRTSSFYEGFHFDENPEGLARLQWMDTNGTGIPEHTADQCIAETPLDTPDDTFGAASSEYALKRDKAYRADLTGQQFWEGTVWYTDKTELLCKCQVIPSFLTETLFSLPKDNTLASFTLKDVLTGTTNLSSSCLVIGHRGSSPSFTYSVVPDGTTIADIAITDDCLTVGSAGTVHVSVTQELNGKTLHYNDYVKIIHVPMEDSFRFTKGLAEDLPLSFDGDGIEFDTRYSFIWNESDHKFMASDDYTMTLDNNALNFILKKDYLNQLDPGEYYFQTNVYVKKDDYNGQRCEYNFKVTITLPTEVDHPVIELSQNRFHYDGLLKKPSVTVKHGDTVIPSSEYAVTYENNLNVGTASVIIKNNAGGNYIVNGQTTFEITNEYRPEKGTDYVTTPLNDGWTNKDFVITAADNRLISTGNTLKDEWVKSLNRTEETAKASVSFYVKNLENGEISLMAEESYKLDKTNPSDYDILFNENSVKKLIHEVSFGLFFRKTVDVRITAEDSLSGIGKISYYLSERALTEEDVRRITDWTDGGHFSLAPEDEKKFIAYVKASDQAGNLVCFSSDGAEFDLTPPEITEVNENTVYYTTQAVTVTDRNLKTVTLNGQPISGDILLSGNVDEAYIIKAVDQAGNESSVTITMKPIQTIAKPISGLLEATVTSDNQPAVKAVITELNLLLESEYLTEQEKAELQDLKSHAEDLDAQITSASNAASSKEIQAVDGISKDTVSMEDKEILEAAKKALETALNEFVQNYTEAEAQAIKEDLDRIDQALKSIQNVQTVTDAIEKLPNPDDVCPDDTETEKMAKEAEKLFEALTNHEKSLADASRLKKVLAALTDYQILEGNNSLWEKGIKHSLSFKANGPVSKFTGILIDGRDVDAQHYSVAPGSTIITLNADYLEKLPVGRHSLTLLYLDGKTTAVFETTEKPSGNTSTGTPVESDGTHLSASPQTGEKSHSLLWLALLAGSVLSWVSFYNKRTSRAA